MKKKPPRRFNTANEIRAEIDRYRAKARKLLAEADQLEEKAKELLGSEGHNEKWVKEQYGFNLDWAYKKRASASRIEEKTMVRLKNKLSEWMTPQIPGIDNGDRSIPAKG